MLKLKLQYFVHLMRRVDSLEKTDAGTDWGQEEKGTTEDEMAGWHHWLNERESKWTLGVTDGQGGLECWNSWGLKELDTTEQLSWTEKGEYTWDAMEGKSLGKRLRIEVILISSQEMRWLDGWCNGHELGQTLGDGEIQGDLACCSPWGREELDMTRWLNSNRGYTLSRRKTNIRETERRKYMMYSSKCVNTYNEYKSGWLSEIIYESWSWMLV